MGGLFLVTIGYWPRCNTITPASNVLYFTNSFVNYMYLLTPWSRVLLEKLTGSAASQEIPRIFRTQKFLIVLTSARHLSLSWANSIQSPQPPPTSWRSILILSSHLCLGLFVLIPCCILRGPGGERIVDVVPGGTELELHLRRGVGQAAHTRNNLHDKCIEVYCRYMNSE